MMRLREGKVFGLFFVSVFLLYFLVLGFNLVFYLRDFLATVYEPDFRRHCKIPNRSVNHVFVYFLLEKVLLQRSALFPFLKVCLAHFHQVPDVELVNPSPLFGHSENGSFCALLFLRGRHERVSELFLVALRVFFPIVKFHR